MSVGDRIRAERERRHISQNQLAKDANISQSGLSSIENTTKNPSIQTIAAIADALHVSVGQLLGEEDSSSPAQQPAQAPYEDPDIRRLARAKKKMPEEEWARMMKIAELGFEKYFKEDS